MVKNERKSRIVAFRLPEEKYQKLVDLADTRSVSDHMRGVVDRTIQCSECLDSDNFSHCKDCKPVRTDD